MGYDEEVREQAVQLYLEGASLRSIGRLLHVHHQSVSNWINAHAHTLPKQVADTEPTSTVEVDELFTYVGKKTNVST
jgi:transposase-like protein